MRGRRNAEHPAARLQSGSSSVPLSNAPGAADIQEMLGTVRRGLEAVSGTGGWLIEVVGGEARSSARHDAGQFWSSQYCFEPPSR